MVLIAAGLDTIKKQPREALGLKASQLRSDEAYAIIRCGWLPTLPMFDHVCKSSGVVKVAESKGH